MAVGINSVSVALSWPVVYWSPTRQPSAGYSLELASGRVSDVRIDETMITNDSSLT